MALSTSTNWLFNFILAFITPPLYSVIHGGFYFILFGSCLVSGFLVFFKYPETSGKTLEELGDVFGDQGLLVNVDEKVAGQRVGGDELVREPGVLVDAVEAQVRAVTGELDLPTGSQVTLLGGSTPREGSGVGEAERRVVSGASSLGKAD